VRQPPELFGAARTRWRVAALRAAVRWAAGYSLSGLGRALARLGIGRQRGRLRLHSPDPAYREKAWDIRHVCSLALGAADPPVVLYGDEFSLYRQPTLGPAFAPAGGALAAPLSCRRNGYYRYAGALAVATGQRTWLGRSKMGVENLRRFLARLRAAYPGRTLYLIWDNWPVHRHPVVLARAAALGIELLWLPTYAPWPNPIEKRWRWLAEDLLRHHRRADRFPELQAQVAAWLGRFAQPNRTLLRYTGLADGLPGP
jgi:putative transposase